MFQEACFLSPSVAVDIRAVDKTATWVDMQSMVAKRSPLVTDDQAGEVRLDMQWAFVGRGPAGGCPAVDRRTLLLISLLDNIAGDAIQVGLPFR